VKFILGPTCQHALKYCEIHDLNSKHYMILDVLNPWYILEWRLAQRSTDEKNEVLVLDNDYMNDPVTFQHIMGYFEEYSDDFRLEIVEGVYFN